MSHEILSVKLCELDNKIGRMHSRIQLSETADHWQLKSEIEALQKECMEDERVIRNNLQFSRAKSVNRISRAYEKIEGIIAEAREEMGAYVDESQSRELSAEERLLFAEYALDFAVEAAERALLISLEAIDAQRTQEETV